MHRCSAARALTLTLALAIVPASAAAQASHPLTGRIIAPVMGPAGASWLDRPDREAEEQPELALNLLGIRDGMVVADVGAGSGYMTVRLARRVGATGKVYANDIQPDMLRVITQRMARERLTNVETILGTDRDPRLPPDAIDLVLMVDVYHELSQPQTMLQKIRQALKPEGRLVLIEYRKEDPAIPILPEHKMSVAEARTEVEAEGYQLRQVLSGLPRQHILIFMKAQGS